MDVVYINEWIEMLTYIDLFCGIGGFRIAFEQSSKSNKVNSRCVFSSDIDKYARETYSLNFKETPSGDITKIKEQDIPEHDLLFAGFPCQAFSISGKKLGFEDTRGTLFFDVARIAAYRKPKVIVLENVKNFATHDCGRTLNVVKETLQNLGYSFFHKVLNSTDYGSPQKRERIYMVAFRKDLKVKEYDFPTKHQKRHYLKDFLEKNGDFDRYIIKRKDIKIIEEKLSKLKNNTIDSIYRIGTINKGGQGERIYHPNGHAITLSAYGGGAASKTGAYLVGNKIRKLTPRECANIMGFPKNFKIHHMETQAYKQFGNSVVVSVLKAIFNDLLSKKIIKI